MDPKTALGLAVENLRREAGLTQAELGRRCELEESWISKIESCEADPKWGDIRRLSEALGIRIDKLAEMVEELEGQ